MSTQTSAVAAARVDPGDRRRRRGGLRRRHRPFVLDRDLGADCSFIRQSGQTKHALKKVVDSKLRELSHRMSLGCVMTEEGIPGGR